MTPMHQAGPDDWTAADDRAVAARERAKLRVFDAHRDDEPHWQDDDATRFRKGFVAGFGLSLPFWIIGAALIAWGW